MKNRVFAEITEKCVNVYTKAGIGWDAASFTLPLEESVVTGVKSPVVLLANTRHAAIRIVDIPARRLLDRLIKPADRWEYVRQGYPIGDKMNETTHIFDGKVFTNAEDVQRFFMVALPYGIAEEMGENCATLFGSASNLECLDTIEHYMFRHFAKQGADSFWVVFPQGDGLRILHLAEGLPKAAWCISNDADFRLDEVSRVFNSLNAEQDIEKTTLKKAVVLNTNLDLDWLCGFFEEHGVEVEKGCFHFTDYLL